MFNLIDDFHRLLCYIFRCGCSLNVDAMFKSLGIRGSIIPVTAVARPACGNGSFERATAHEDACVTLYGLWFSVGIITSCLCHQCATLKYNVASAVDTLSTIAAAGHRERTACHSEWIVTLYAGSAAVVSCLAVVNTIAACSDCSVATIDDNDRVTPDTAGSICCYFDVYCAVVYP